MLAIWLCALLHYYAFLSIAGHITDCTVSICLSIRLSDSCA